MATLPFESMVRWFFVLHLPLDEQKSGARYEVQLLDNDGRATAFASYEEESSLTVGGVVVPEAVLAAGRTQAAGLGVYVDESGEQTAPF